MDITCTNRNQRAVKKQKKLIVAIEGDIAAGKSTLSALLKEICDCNVFHIDDFFLPPSKRIPQRYTQPGSNIDYNRFCKEILIPVKKGEQVHYCRYDCNTFIINPPINIGPKILNIVEGTYSCHPHLSNYYDLKVFLKINPEQQSQRIRKRNNPIWHTYHFGNWYQMERTNYNKLHLERQCDFILEAQ